MLNKVFFFVLNKIEVVILRLVFFFFVILPIGLNSFENYKTIHLFKLFLTFLNILLDIVIKQTESYRTYSFV